MKTIDKVKSRLSPVPVQVNIVVGEKASPEFVKYLNELKETQEILIKTVNDIIIQITPP